MTSHLSERLKDPVTLLRACQVALPSWSGVTLDNFTSTVLKGGHSSPSVYLVTCTVPHAKPDRAVVKLDRAVVKVEGEVPEHTFKVRCGKWQT